MKRLICFDLHHHIREIILSARSLAARSVDTVQVSMNYAIGQRIVEHEQQGEQRAAYGQRVLSSLAEALTAEFGKGFSATNLSLMRPFYMVYSPRIGQSVSDLFQPRPIHQTASDKSALEPVASDAIPALGQAPHARPVSFPCF